MSKYTTEVRFLCESVTGHTESEGFNSIEQILTDAAPLIFNFSWPIFDENYRLTLEKKILRHYYTREISEETVGLWKLRLDDRLNNVMPYYNQLYESALLDFNPFYDVNLKRTHTSQQTGNRSNTFGEDENVKEESAYNDKNKSEGISNDIENGSNANKTVATDTQSGSASKNQWDKYSDTPQGGVTGLDNFSGATVANMAYLTNARNINESDSNSKSGSSNVEGEGTSNINRTGISEGNSESEGQTNRQAGRTRTGFGNDVVTNLNEYSEQVLGKSGSKSYSNMLKEFRETFLNIDAMILEELRDLFFLLW